MGGVQVGTVTFFPEFEMDILIVKVGGLNSGATVSAKVWGLESGWTSEESSNGTVSGNVTMGSRVKRDRGEKIGWMEF